MIKSFYEEPVKLGYDLVEFAKKNRCGFGSFHCEDGSSVKILSNIDTNISHYFHMKNGLCIGYKGTKGDNSRAAVMDKLNELATNVDDVLIAIGDSFDRII